MSQQMQHSTSKEKSEKDKVDEYIASINIEKEKGYLNTIFKDLYLLPIFDYRRCNQRRGKNSGTISTLNHIDEHTLKHFCQNSIKFICELYAPTRDENLYIIIDNKDLKNVFEKNIKISNALEQKLIFDKPDTIKLNINDDYIKFKDGNEYKYGKSKNKITNHLNLNYRYLSFDDDLIKFDKFINNEKFDDVLLQNFSLPDGMVMSEEMIRDNINASFSIEKKNLIKKCINKKYQHGYIAKCEVGEKINIYIDSESISCENPLKFSYKKPSDDNSQFINVVDNFNVNSLSELEMQPVTLCKRKPNNWSKKSKGWYLSTKKSNFQVKYENIINKIKKYNNYIKHPFQKTV